MTDGVRGQGWTPLMYAAAAGDLASARLLIQRKADVDARDPLTGVTPLMLAASGGHAQVVITLLDDGHADLRAIDVHKRDAQDHAARGGHDDLARMLEMRAVDSKLHTEMSPPRTLKPIRPDGSLAKPRHEGEEP